jgi:hypothetical protein
MDGPTTRPAISIANFGLGPGFLHRLTNDALDNRALIVRIMRVGSLPAQETRRGTQTAGPAEPPSFGFGAAGKAADSKAG